jgi:hypothetical protein
MTVRAKILTLYLDRFLSFLRFRYHPTITDALPQLQDGIPRWLLALL